MPLIDGGTVRLPRIVGQGIAMDLILTGGPVDAQEALRIVLVNRVVPAGSALTHAKILALQIAQHPQPCMRHDRLSLPDQWGREELDALTNEWQRGMTSLAQGLEGVTRFIQGQGRHGA